MQLSFRKPVDGALFLLRQGYKVFPLVDPTGKPADKRKSPAITGWKEWAVTCTERRVVDYGTANPVNNWGVHAGPSNLVILDLDKKHGKDGEASLASAHISLPVTFTVRTPTGGKHLYFIGSSTPQVNVLPGVDVRAGDSYVVAPGSVLDDQAYEIIASPPPAKLPDSLLELFNKRKAPLKPLDDKTVFPHGERDQSLTRYAGKLRAMGLDREEILTTLSQMNQSRCDPPLPEKDLERIAASMMRYAPDIAESASTIRFDKAAPEGADAPINVNDFKGEPSPRAWLVKDWIPEGEISSLYGSGGTGKSLLSLQLACCVASGRPWLGLEVARPTPVLAVFCEDTKDELHRRLVDIRNSPEYKFADSIGNAPCFLWPRVGLSNDLARENDRKTDIVHGLFRPALENALKAMPEGPRLLILDTLSDVYLGDENVREKVNKFVKTHLGSLVQEYNCTLLILAHPSRQGQNTGDALSGSTAWENSVRNRLALIPYDKKIDTGLMCLVRMKSNYAKKGEKVVVRWCEGRYLVASSAEQTTAKLTTEEHSLMADIDSIISHGPMTLHELSVKVANSSPSLCHLSSETIKNRIKKVLSQEIEYKGALFSLQNVALDGGKKPTWRITKTAPKLVSSFGAEEAENLDDLLA